LLNAEVIVNVSVPEYVIVKFDAGKFIPPVNVNPAVPAHVTAPAAGALILILKQVAPVPIVNVYAVAFEAELKITESAEVGKPALPPPPGVNDQFVVVVASQVPEPPTQ
jgi:hypothetical protein